MVVEVPSAVTVGELATMLKVVAEGAPATKFTEVCSCTLPLFALPFGDRGDRGRDGFAIAIRTGSPHDEDPWG
jgi:hypothetical protein